MSLLLEALAIVAAICVCGLILRRATGRWQWRLAASAIVVVVAGAMAATYAVTSGRALVYSGQQEPAEHYWEQLKGAGLTMAPLEQG